MDDDKLMDFDIPTDPTKIIKVIGVGGGGGNAVNNMFKEGIHNVSFVLCNTDRQAFDSSDIPVKITLGLRVTNGLGAGNKPEVGKAAAEEDVEQIKKMLGPDTKMAFITAGMGGGTGTGAAPVIAKIAKDMGVLTVGIVTIPFEFEGRPKKLQAIKGVEELAKNVDALLVINNERLYSLYSGLTKSTPVREAFKKADDTLTTAAKSIAEIITLPGIINIDFADVRTTMKDGGVALMSNGFGEGEGRLETAIQEALNSPLLNSNDVFNAKKILFNISFSDEAELTIEEIRYMNDFMSRFSDNINVIWGTALDNSIGKQVKFTIIATGFGVDDILEVREQNAENYEIQRAKEDELLGKYYADVPKNQIRKVSSKNIMILSAKELDDDNLIAYMEENPTYKRDPNDIARLREKGARPEAKTLSATTRQNASPTVISFS